MFKCPYGLSMTAEYNSIAENAYVVGGKKKDKPLYSEFGTKIQAEVENEKSVVTDLYSEHAANFGGVPVPAKTNKKGKQVAKLPTKPKASNKTVPAELEEIEEVVEEVKPVYVWFKSQFGKTRVTVQSCINEELAMILVFASEDQLTFTPNIGESLTLVDEFKEDIPVFYTGVTFTWIDGVKRAMILFKSTEEKSNE